jgi:hypothetical protein
VLDRPRQDRSQFVFTEARGRAMIVERINAVVSVRRIDPSARKVPETDLEPAPYGTRPDRAARAEPRETCPARRSGDMSGPGDRETCPGVALWDGRGVRGARHRAHAQGRPEARPARSDVEMMRRCGSATAG